jgi:hypothetical protein
VQVGDEFGGDYEAIDDVGFVFLFVAVAVHRDYDVLDRHEVRFVALGAGVQGDAQAVFRVVLAGVQFVEAFVAFVFQVAAKIFVANVFQLQQVLCVVGPDIAWLTEGRLVAAGDDDGGDEDDRRFEEPEGLQAPSLRSSAKHAPHSVVADPLNERVHL